MRSRSLGFLWACGLALLLPSPAIAQMTANRSAAHTPARKVITSEDQLPRRSYQLNRKPSELLDAPKSELDEVIEALDKNLAADLELFDIRDRAMRADMLEARADIAIHRGDLRAAQAFYRQVRTEQEKPAEKLTSGVMIENVLETRLQGGSLDEQRRRLDAALAQSWDAMPWAVVGENLKRLKATLELLSKNRMVGGFKTELDPAAINLGLNVPDGIVLSILSVRNTFNLIPPFREDIIGLLQRVIDRNRVAKADVWSPRLVALPASANGTPVVVGIWDSGTDVDLFRPAKVRGIAFDADSKPMQALVRPLGSAEARLPVLKQYLKGMLDVGAAIDSSEASALKQRLATLQSDEVEQFEEDLSAVKLWAHGTHVAGIALAGNPFARVTAVAMHPSIESVPEKPDEASARRVAASYQAAVQSFKQAGARVVNMSWTSSPAAYEGALVYHNIGGTPEQRQQLAKKLFDIEKQALQTAIAGAPEILFVAAAGNANADAAFQQKIPAAFELPNLITAGAVDQSGAETSFSSFGRTVVVHANGFEVSSYVPGGEQLKLSGTSMAAPQVANLAAKVFAMRPDFTVAQVKALILKGAERNGRVNLINPKATLELAGVKLART